MPRSKRVFSAAFKAQLVRDLLAGTHSHADLCRQHQLSPWLLTTWKDTVLQRLDLLFADQAQRDAQATRIAELEQLLGRQALELDLLKKASTLRAGSPARHARSS